MADCDKRIIKSPISGEEVESKTWRHIYEQVGENPIEADRLYEQLLSPEFTTWFGDWVNNSPDASKVINENGEPLMVYHGTDKDFHTFDKSLSGAKTGWGEKLPGIYFFDHKSAADDYTIDKEGGSGWYRFERDMQGMDTEQLKAFYPDVFSAYENDKESQEIYGLEEFAWGYFNKQIQKGPILPAFLSLRNPVNYDSKGRRLVHEIDEIAGEVRPNNDGLIITHTLDRLQDDIGFEDTVYIVHKPNQIKSVFNEGKYSTQKGEYELSGNYHTEPFIFDGSNYTEFSKRRQELIAKGARDVELSGNSIRYNADADNIYFQSIAEKLKSSKASDETVSDWKLWFKQTGTDLKILTEDLTDDQGNKLDANESVDVLNGVVKVTQGNENTAIPEAGMHIVARIIKQNYPEMFKEMMKRVDKFSSFPDIVQEYKRFKNYQLPDGKPDMAKIKEEAIGKYLAEFQILDKEGMTEKPELIEQTRTWWQKIKDFLYDFFKGNPFSKTVKDFNNAFRESNREEISGGLDEHLQKFLEPYNVETRIIDNFKEKFGTDSLGVADVLNKVIYLNAKKDRNIDTYAEEFSHILEHLMGQNHPIMKDLLKNIHLWSEYEGVIKEYDYGGNDQQQRLEAIGKLLKGSIVNNWKIKESEKNKTILQKIIDAVKEFFAVFSAKYMDDFEKKVDPIAKAVLNMDRSMIYPIDKTTEKLNYEEAIKNNPHAKAIIDKVYEKLPDSKLTGSLAIAMQGESIIRPSTAPIHDVDFVVNQGSYNQYDIAFLMKKLNAIPSHDGIVNRLNYCVAYAVPAEGYKVKEIDRNPETNIVRTVSITNSTGKEVYNGLFKDAPADKLLNVDFFIKNKESGEHKYTQWQDVYWGKNILSWRGEDSRMLHRDKDILDYVQSNPKNRDKIYPEFLYFQHDQSAGPDKGKQVFDDIKLRAQDTEHIIDEVAAKEEDKNYYRKKSTGERIKNRVTDRSKKVLRTTFGDSERLPEWDEKAKTGIAGHADINDVLERYIDRDTGIINRGENGELISTREPMESRINPKEQGYYQMLEKMVTELIKAYPSTTRFVWEELLYDPDKDEVGSPDLLAIHAEGTVDNYDWKFLDIKETTKDIPKYKKQAYNAQMQGYANILRKQYGVEKIGRSRIMPIQAMYAHDGLEYKFAGIKTANSEDFYKGEHREYLLPVPSTEERYTADPRVQSYINNLNSVLGKLEDIAGDLQGKERLSVNEDIKQLTTAIRHLQVKQDVTDSANFAMKEMDNLAKKLQTYKEVFDNSKEGEYTEEDLARISKDLNIARDMITPFEGLEHYFKEPAEVELLTKLTRRVWEARDYIKELESQVLEKGYANPRGIFGVAGEDPTTGKTYADRVITFFQNLYDVHSNASTRAGQLFSNLISEAYNKYIIDADVTEEKHVVIKDSVKEWVKTHSADSLDKLLLKQGKNQFGRVDKYAKDFYTKLKEHLSKKDGKWISENINTVAYVENYEKEFKNFKEWAHEYATFQTTNKDKQDRIAYELIEQFQKKYDIQLYPKDALTSSNDKLYRFPTEKWYSTEYKELLKPENKPVLDYYNYVQETVDRAKAAGIDIKNPSSFFPMGEKTFVESIAGQNKFQNIIRNLGSTVTLRPGEGGKIDPLTDAPQDKLMVHFIQDISHENNKGERDYTNISRNIFTMMDLFNAQIDKYANFSKIEDVTKLLLHVEKEKKVIETTLSNKVVMKDGQPSLIADNKNYEFLEHLVDVGLYEKDGSYLESGLGFVYDWNKTAEKWNKVLGADVMPLSSDETIYISIPKAVKTLNRRVIFKALGFNPLSAIANLFGGRVQAWIDNRFVSKEDLNLGRNLIAKANFMSEEGQVAGALLKYFTPYTTDELLQKARKDDLSAWNKWLSSNTLMSMLHGSEMHVQSSNALAYMKNLIVRNGKMVHAWEYLKDKYGYDKIYDLPAEKVKEIKDKMNKELKELKENESILKISKVVDGKLVIPGIDNKKDSSVLDARDKMMQMNRDATGSLTATEKMRMDQNFVGNSLMMFKHWIPPLVQTRFGNMTFNAGSNTYRWGRWKMLGAAVSERGLGAVTQLVGHLTGNEQSVVELAKALYKKKRAEIAERGETLQFDHNMSEAEFIDMYRDGMRANLTDAIAALTLLGAHAAITAAQKENEDEEKAGIYRAMAKISDKLSDELLFFYSPVTFMELTGGSHSALIPAMGIFTDTEKFLRSSAKEIYFDATGDEESAEKNKLAKFPISYTPGINKITEWYAMFDDDFSVELKGRKAPNK